MYCKSCASAIIFPITNYAQLAPLSRCNHTASSSRNLTLPVQTTNFCAVLVLLLINVPTKPTQLAVDCEWNILYHNQVCLYDTDQNPRRNRGPTWCWSYHPVTFTMGPQIRYKTRTKSLLFRKLIDIYRNLLAASHEIYCRPIYPYAN